MDTLEFLQSLVGLSLCYGLKSPDVDLYDFGFGDTVNDMESCGETEKIYTHILHVTCKFQVVSKNGERRVDTYYGDTPCEHFHAEVKRLVGLKVRRVALSAKNDLWLDFGDYWVVFITYEDAEESWRFFTRDEKDPHLVVSDAWVQFVY